jgi:hypothetical protein
MIQLLVPLLLADFNSDNPVSLAVTQWPDNKKYYLAILTLTKFHKYNDMDHECRTDHVRSIKTSTCSNSIPTTPHEFQLNPDKRPVSQKLTYQYRTLPHLHS